MSARAPPILTICCRRSRCSAIVLRAALPLKLDPRKQGEAAVAGSGDRPPRRSAISRPGDHHQCQHRRSHSSIALLPTSRLPPKQSRCTVCCSSAHRLRVTGDAVLGATAAGDFLDGPLTAQLSVMNLALGPVAREFGIATVASLDADALAVSHRQAHWYGAQPRSRYRARCHPGRGARRKIRTCARQCALHRARRSPSTAAKRILGAGKLLFAGAYMQQDGDLHNGELRVDLTAQAITASRVAAFRQSARTRSRKRVWTAKAPWICASTVGRCCCVR